jgi:hypothetical protein
MLSKMACMIRAIENFIVKDGEIESKTETNGMRWGKFGNGYI